jgi:hypothetical protein
VKGGDTVLAVEFEVNTERGGVLLGDWPHAQPIKQGDTLSVDGGPERRVKAVRPNEHSGGITVELEPLAAASSASRSS